MDLDVSADGNGSRELRDMEENLRASMAVDVSLTSTNKRHSVSLRAGEDMPDGMG